MTLAERAKELHRALAHHRIPHAFGGALALAYWTREPRGTRDIDLNIFVPAARCETALRALPAGITQPSGTVEEVRRTGQVRLRWDETPIDLFFDNLPIHGDAARHREIVSLAGEDIPVLGATELAAFKAMFDRTQDWADIEAMLEAGKLDVAELREVLGTMLSDDDHRFARLDEAARRAIAEAP